VLHQGQISFIGTVDELRGDSALRHEVRVKADAARLAEALRAAGCEVEPLAEEGLSVRLPAGGDTDVIFAAALAAGVQIRHLAPHRATLEAAFLRAVGGGPSSLAEARDEATLEASAASRPGAPRRSERAKLK
jgi:hypothetical protein